MYDNFSSFQAFSYFHFLVNEKEEFDIYKVFRQYDTGNIHMCLLRSMGYTAWGCQRCNFVLQGALNCLNLRCQVAEHVVYGLKRPIWKMAHLICKNDEALRKVGVLACRFDTPYPRYLFSRSFSWLSRGN